MVYDDCLELSFPKDEAAIQIYHYLEMMIINNHVIVLNLNIYFHWVKGCVHLIVYGYENNNAMHTINIKKCDCIFCQNVVFCDRTFPEF